MSFWKALFARFRREEPSEEPSEPEREQTPPRRHCCCRGPLSVKMPDQIEVVDCCGVYGYLIPWAAWKCFHIPIVPTRDFSRPYVYLYSIVGQLGHAPGAVVPRVGSGYHLLLDQFIDWDSKQVDWERLRQEIVALVESRARREAETAALGLNNA